jgi:hypothetical protein
MTFLREFLEEGLDVLSTRVDVERRGEVGGLYDYPTPARRRSRHEGHGTTRSTMRVSDASSARFGIPPMLRQLSLPLIQTTCFFCQSHINPPPRDPRNFKCPHCQCWNRYDPRGEIISDEPAMHEPGMNAKSFAKRGKPAAIPNRRVQLNSSCTASPRNDRFLPSYGKTVFCNTCQTNQVCSLRLKFGPRFHSDKPSTRCY